MNPFSRHQGPHISLLSSKKPASTRGKKKERHGQQKPYHLRIDQVRQRDQRIPLFPPRLTKRKATKVERVDVHREAQRRSKRKSRVVVPLRCGGFGHSSSRTTPQPCRSREFDDARPHIQLVVPSVSVHPAVKSETQGSKGRESGTTYVMTRLPHSSTPSNASVWAFHDVMGRSDRVEVTTTRPDMSPE